jgi:hypothetical protein
MSEQHAISGSITFSDDQVKRMKEAKEQVRQNQQGSARFSFDGSKRFVNDMLYHVHLWDHIEIKIESRSDSWRRSSIIGTVTGRQSVVDEFVERFDNAVGNLNNGL